MPDYLDWVRRQAALLAEGAAIGTAPLPPAPSRLLKNVDGESAGGDRRAPERSGHGVREHRSAADRRQMAASGVFPQPASTALIFAPHPDDEVIVGALPLRLQRECSYRIVNVAVTLGSRVDRRAARWTEARHACAALGFDLDTPDPDGLHGINLAARTADPANWTRAVAACADLIARHRPHLLLLPHAQDWNQTHIGVHALVTDAMAACAGLDCLVVETEFWGAMAAPNLMVASSVADVATLVAALSLHVGEVARNPFHLRLPAWMIDNVRRGAELVGGQGGPAPDITFATLYRLRRWRAAAWHDILPAGLIVGEHDRLPPIFGPP